MPEGKASASGSSARDAAAEGGGGASPVVDIRQVWQLPALFAAVVLMALAVGSMVYSAPSPDFAGMLEHGSRLLEQERYTDALSHLNGRVLPFVGEDTPAEHKQRFFVLRARALAMIQKVHGGGDRPENHQRIVTEYAKAEAAGARLEPADAYRLALAYIGLDKLDKALERAQGLPPKEARPQRTEILRRLVEVKFESPTPEPNSTLSLITMFLDEEPGASDRAWALARQAELLLRQGYAQQAVDRLLLGIPGVWKAEADRRGDLHLLLARAYNEIGAVPSAAGELEKALGLLPEGDTRRGRAMVLLAQIESARGEQDAARQRYADLLEQFDDHAVRLPAVLGLAESLAATGDTEGASREYTRLVDEVGQGRRHPDVSTEVVSRSLMSRYAELSGADDAEGALRFAMLCERLMPGRSTPPDVLLALAGGHRRTAERRLGPAGSAGSRVADLVQLDPETRERARGHLVSAAEYYRRHAGAVVDLDNEAFGNSLWLAADCFDRAGDQSEAMVLFGEFAEGFRNDPRRDEARFRMAQAFQARGDYDLAAARYRELIDEAAGRGGSPFADASHVPLARALLANSETSDDDEARLLLSGVVEGRVGGTETPEYREALVLLARVHVQAGEHAGAIALLEEALARFPAEQHSAGLLFELAEAHRRDAAAIARTLQDELPESERAALEATRVERLRRAMDLYTRVRDGLFEVPAVRLSDGDALRLRNSQFYVADCAFELRDFERAIRLYDAARERYPRDPASLVAMIQIVNAYVEQGDLTRAATANERARRFYESLPEDAWSDPNLPIGRREWQRWLDSLAVLGGVAGAEQSDPPP